MKLNLPVSLNTGMDWITETAERRNTNLSEANEIQCPLVREASTLHSVSSGCAENASLPIVQRGWHMSIPFLPLVSINDEPLS